jgi:hypothetical protein
MFGILMSALWAASGYIIGFIFRSVIVKFVVFFALFYVTTEFTAVLLSSGILPTPGQAQNYISAIPPSAGYFLSVFNVYAGISLILSAYSTRFIIRRIPKL